MPRVNIYIRNADWEKWQQIADKPRFIQDALRGVSPEPYNKAVGERKEIEKIIAPALKAMKKNSVPHAEKPCPHGFAKGFCKKADCNRKYAK